MAFVSMPGLKGKVYVPDESGSGSKKHPCKDCFSCQQCSDDRCRVCLSLRQCCCNRKVREKSGVCHNKSYSVMANGIGKS